MPTNVYVDAFNLYYGCLRGTPHRWLDVATLCRRLLPGDTINRIRYFTASVNARGDPGRPQRQQTYLRALATIPNLTIHYGHFLVTPRRLPLAQPAASGPRTALVLHTEEKGSDVNLATHLLLDAFKKDCDIAVIISNDSDLKEPIQFAQRELGLKVGVINPQSPQRRSRALRPTFFKQIRLPVLRACQFEAVLKDAKGEIRKPASW